MDAHLFSASFVNIDPFFLVEIYGVKKIPSVKICDMPKILNLFPFHLFQKSFDEKYKNSVDHLRGHNCLISAVSKYRCYNLLCLKHSKS